jgi:hypothetical protein
MAGLERKVHMVSGVEWGPIDKFAPDLGIRTTPENGGDPEVPKALCFADPDGERHVYVFSEEGRLGLIKQLTGGLVVPKSRLH